jgi:DNA-directed RNA polymerase specialized sigma24 family protein
MTSLAISNRRATQLQRLMEKRRTVDHAAERARLELRRAVELAREEGASYEEIADLIGITRQRAWAMFNKKKD